MHRWAEFPALVSYNRFKLTPSVLVPLLAYLQSQYHATVGCAFRASLEDNRKDSIDP